MTPPGQMGAEDHKNIDMSATYSEFPCCFVLIMGTSSCSWFDYVRFSFPCTQILDLYTFKVNYRVIPAKYELTKTNGRCIKFGGDDKL